MKTWSTPTGSSCYNAGGSTVDLTGWHLTDRKSNLTRWTFPATNLPAGGFLLVFASGKDRTTPNLHANFSLSDSGEYLALVHPDGTNVEHEYRGVPDQFPDISYGIQTHGSQPHPARRTSPAILIYHTPGAPTPACRPPTRSTATIRWPRWTSTSPSPPGMN